MKTALTHTGIVLLCLASMMTAACNPGPQNAVQNKALIIGVSQDYRATDVFSHKGFNCLVFQTLVKMDAKGAFQPLLAESWEVSPDGKTYVFHIRENAVFSDGSPVTAQQVKASMMYRESRKRKRGPSRYADRGPKSEKDSADPLRGTGDEQINREYGTFDNQRYNLPRWRAFQSIDVMDDQTLRFNLPRPYTLFLNELATTHSYPVLKADPSEEVTGYIGTGPYKIDSLKRTQYMTLIKNGHFWQGDVGIERIRLKVIPDAETRAISLEAGEIHLTGYDHFDKLPNESVLRLKRLPDITVAQLAAVDQPSIAYMTINYKKPFFRDPDVRKAVGLAIDRSAIDQIMSQSGRTLDGPFPADYRLHNPDIPGHRFDPERARQLLTKAGWTDLDKNGILDKGGETFSISLCFSAFDPHYKIVAEIVQAQLKKVGIALNLRMMELGAHITAMRNGDYELALWPMMRYHMFFYTGHPSWLNVYSSPELDDAFTRFLHGGDEQTRREGANQTQKIIMESRALPLFFERFDVAAWNHDVLENFVPQPLGWDLGQQLWKADLKDG